MSFVLGAWTNLRFTRLASSVLLALPLPILIIAANPRMFTSPSNWVPVMFFVIVFVLHILLFPLARELYFRLTNPVREGVGTLFFAFPLVIIYWALRVAVYIALNVVALPLGLISWIYLSLNKRYA